MFCVETRQLQVLVEFHQNTTHVDVFGLTKRRPRRLRVFVLGTCAAASVPPPASVSAVFDGFDVVVTAWATEHPSIGDPVRILWIAKSITGVSAVPGHRQNVLASLITDGERRVLS